MTDTLKVTEGETVKLAGRWIANAVPVDLTGYVLTAEVRLMYALALSATATLQRGAGAVAATGSGGLTVTPEPTSIPSTFGVGSAMSIYVESATVANAIGDLAEAP